MATRGKTERRGLGIGAIDVMAAAGLASVTYGCWLVYQPLAFVVCGGLLMAAAVYTARRG